MTEQKQGKRSAADREKQIVAYETAQREKNACIKSSQLMAEYNHWIDHPNPCDDDLAQSADKRSGLAFPSKRSFLIKSNEYDQPAMDIVKGHIQIDAEERGFKTSSNDGYRSHMIVGHSEDDVRTSQTIFPKCFSARDDVQKIPLAANDRESQLLMKLTKRAVESGCFDGARLEFRSARERDVFSDLAKESFELADLRFIEAGENGSIMIEIRWHDTSDKMKHPFRMSHHDCYDIMRDIVRSTPMNRW
jgi:hypothetical protein